MSTQILNKPESINRNFIDPDFIPDLVIYHNVVPGFACPDAFAAIWVVNKRYSSYEYSPTFLGCCYDDKELPNIENYTNILVVDFSFSEDVLDAWKQQNKVVYVLDHHKAFKQRLEAGNAKKSYSLGSSILKSDKILIDLDESGATLAWKCLFPDQKMPVFLEYVRDRDLFTKQLPSSDIVHAAYGKLRRSFNLYDQLAELDQQMLIEFMQPLGQISMDKKYKAIAKYMKKIEFWGNIPVVVLNKSEISLKSDLGEFICHYYPFAKFCIILGKGINIVRLRSSIYTANIDLITLFADVDASGHTNAASFHYFKDSSENLDTLKAVILEHAERLKALEDSEFLNNYDLIEGKFQ